MKEYGCCPQFKRGDNSTDTFMKRGGMYLVSATPYLLNCLLNFYETLHSCSTQPADVHEGIPQNLKGEKIQLILSRKRGGMYLVSATPTKLLIEFL
jgi:hypothetical protein